MAKKSKAPNPFAGRWRIVSMSAWDEEFIDEEEEGYFEFGKNDQGEFHFGYVHGQMDCRLTTREGEPTVEWTWDGNDEMDPAQGRGWAVIRDSELHGMIFFHGGDEPKEFATVLLSPPSPGFAFLIVNPCEFSLHRMMLHQSMPASDPVGQPLDTRCGYLF